MGETDSREFNPGGKEQLSGPIRNLEFDDNNAAEMAAHGITREEVAEILRNRYALLRNAKRHRNQPYIMVGQTDGGRWLAVPIGRSQLVAKFWRPATAFPAGPEQIAKALRTLGGPE